MKNWLIAGIWVFFVLVSCSVDYDFGGSGKLEKDRLVVNCLICPQKNIKAHFYATLHTDSGYVFRPVKNVYATLKENETVLFDGLCVDSVLLLEVAAKPGCAYSLQLRREGYDAVTAETYVPAPMNCTAEEGYVYVQSYGYLMTISNLSGGDGQSALWMKVAACRENGSQSYYSYYHTLCTFLDRVNRESEAAEEESSPEVGSAWYVDFMRVKPKSVESFAGLTLVPSGMKYGKEEEDKENWNSPVVGNVVLLTTASYEYDRYHKSVYEQRNGVISDEGIFAFMYQPTSVYSNIRNGFGIFAGYNCTSVEVKVNREENNNL